MPRPITINEATRRLKWIGGSVDRYGLVSPFRTIGKYLRKKAVKNVRQSRDNRGVQWEKTYSEPLEKVRHKDPVPMLLSNGQVVTQKIKTRKGKQARKRFRQKYGPPLRKLRAIHRGGKFATQKRIADFLNTPGRSIRFGKWAFEFGFTPGTRWVEKLQFGGTYKGGMVPKRTILGLTFLDREFIGKTLADFVDRKLSKL